jgi:hypothetical protein
MKVFSVQHRIFDKSKPVVFTEKSAPDWLKAHHRPGSTMDTGWFWEQRVLKLEVGDMIETDYRKVTRLEDVEENLPA